MILLNSYLIYIAILCSNFVINTVSSECMERSFGYSSFVCVCDETHCDELEPVTTPDHHSITIFRSSMKGKRWNKSIQHVSPKSEHYKKEYDEEADIVVEIYPKEKFQKIFGFGGAFTDATGINLYKLSTHMQSVVINGYYGEFGLEYNLGRVPIGGTDFSIRPYSYDDLPPGQTDPDLKYFKLQKEDLFYKIPYIHQAQMLCQEREINLKLYGSPWSSPGWMKTNGVINGKGSLLKKYYPTWASYILRFLEEYSKHDINFIAITAQNEPTTGLLFDYPFNTIGWTPLEQGDWIANHLGPTLKQNGKNVTILIGDDQRFLFPIWVEKVMSVPGAAEFVGGVAIHWYYDSITPLLYLDLTHKIFPTLPILYTEACSGGMAWDLKRVMLGSWERGEDYIADIIENLEHWTVGWTDWNLALNTEGGPNWVENFVDSPILVNHTSGEIYRQPTFYALAHVSKIIPEGSQRLRSQSSGSKFNFIRTTTFERPDGSLATIFLNRNSSPVTVEFRITAKSFRIEFEERSIASIVWNS